MITFAIVAHNEAETVATAVAHAIAAARGNDRVLAVDSGSSDGTAAEARRSGADVLTAPAGKGRAMAMAAEAATSEWICFLDADVPPGSPNYAARLREAAERTDADHLLGEYLDEQASLMSNTVAIYQPLVAALFPEAAGKFGEKPLTGFRVVRRRFLEPGRFPADFGVEAYLNLAVMLRGGACEVAPIGVYQSRFRYKPSMGLEISRAVLDVAQCCGRLSSSVRPRWERWVGEAVDVISRYRGTDEERPAYGQRLMALLERPLPSAVSQD